MGFNAGSDPNVASVVTTTPITGFVTVSGAVAANQGAASGLAWPIAHVASHVASQGASVFYVSTLSNTVTNVKASSGVVYGYSFYNPISATVAFVQVFKVTAASVTLGTTVPYFTVVVPSGAVAARSFQTPVGFASGIAIVAAASTSGSTAPPGQVNVTVDYQ